MTPRRRVPLWADRLFSSLLTVYPAAFREEYAGEMRAVFRSRFREESRARGKAGLARLWAGVLLDVLVTAPRAHGEILERDVRYAWRSLTRPENRSFTAAALLTLALGIGAVTAVYTVVHGALFAPLPFRDPDRVVRIWEVNPGRGIDSFSSSTPNFHSLQGAARGFTGFSALRSVDTNLTGGGEPEQVSGIAASANLFDLLGIRPVVGRTFLPADDARGGAPVALISEGLWQRRYGGSRAALGQTVAVDLVPHTLVGVVPQNVGFADEIDLWLPLGHDPEVDENRGDRRLAVLGRLAPGVTLEQAQSELGTVASRLAREFPGDNKGWSLRLAPARDWIVGADLSRRLRLVLAAVALLLLVAATNVANLQLARAGARAREIGVRLALGASRARLVRQLVTENLVLATAGGFLGIGLAVLGVRAAAPLLPVSISRLGAFPLGLPLLAVALLSIGATALVAGLLPARLAARASLQDTLRQAGRATTGGRGPARQALVAVQLALATTLAIGAALLAQSLIHLQGVALGFSDPDHLLTTRLARQAKSSADLERDRAFYDAFLAEVRRLPGVASAAVSSEAPFGELDTSMAVHPVPPSAGLPEEGVQASWRIVSADYFATLRVPLLRGRTFAPRGEPGASAVLSRGLARRLWPDGEDPVGREVVLDNGRTFRVIGVAGDVRHLTLAGETTPTIYLSPSWYLWPTMVLVVRTEGDPAALARPVREALARVDPLQPAAAFETLRGAIRRHAAAPRLHAVLLGAFAGLALLLAAVGVTGVVGYALVQRTRELAVRQALGATGAQVALLLTRGGLTLCAAGIGTGLALALAFCRALSGVLYGVRAYDPATFAGTAAALLLAAAVATWLPARRALRISPELTLREG